jgi:FOG: Ankyrin repeat
MGLVPAILEGDIGTVARLVVTLPELAAVSFHTGASRHAEGQYFLNQIRRYLYAGDTALHIAAAAYQVKIADLLIKAGADVHATNRLGYTPLHSAAVSAPGTPLWNPAQQTATIRLLVAEGADPDVTDRREVTPMHIAVRTRGAMAVQTLLELGADPARKNKNGSNAMLLAVNTTGRSGSGSAEAKAEQQRIVELLRSADLRSGI